MYALSIILILLNFFLLYNISRNGRVHTMLKVLWWVSYFGWGAIPLALTITPIFENMIVIPMDIYLLYANINQIALFLINIIAYNLIKKVHIPKLLIKNDFQYSKRFNSIIFWFCSLVLLFILFKLLTTSLGYQERNDIANLSEDSALGLFSLLEDFSVFILLAQAIWRRDLLGRKKNLISEILISLYVLAQVYNGRRVYLFFFIIVILYVALSKKNNKKYLFYALIGGSAALWLLPVIGELRQSDKIKLENVTTAQGGKTIDILGEVITKTNSVQYSCYLLLHDGIGTKGATMYTSTSLALVPRILYPKKPVPGSVDGTLNGIPARLNAIYHRDNYNEIENNGITSSLEALWAMGWGMYFFQIMILGYMIFIFNGILYGGKPLFVYFMFSLIGFPVCVLDISLVKLLLGIQRYIIIYLFAKLLFNHK